MSASRFAKTSIFVTIIMLVGYVLSFAKEAVIANYYGVSSSVDAYTIALTIPVTLFALVSVAVQSIVVPFYSNLYYNNKSPEKANTYISNLITVVSFFSIAITLLCELFASPLITLFAPGFDIETHGLATSLLRITLPTIVFTIVDKVLIGVLNVHKQFILPSFSVYLLNIGLIASIFILHLSFGITAACIGQVIGSVLQVIFLILVANKYYHYKFVFNLKDNNIVQSAKQSIPIIWSMSIAEINAMINRIVASYLFVGSIAALGYASKINGILMTFFTAAISTIVYPLYAESSAKGNMEQLNNRVNFTLSLYALFLLPLMAGIICYKEELVALVFGRGAFDQNAIDVTQSLLGCYCVGLLFMAIRDTITKVYYSLRNTKTPAINATIGVVVNIILNVTLPFIFGVEGLAIATSITAAAISVLLIVQLLKKFESIKLEIFWRNIKPIVISTLIMFFFIVFMNHILLAISPNVRLFTGIAVGVIVYFILLYILKAPILKEITSIISHK